MDDPRTFHVECDSQGFSVVDDYGEWHGRERHWERWIDAHNEIARLVDNYEPPEIGDAWTGGFAENH